MTPEFKTKKQQKQKALGAADNNLINLPPKIFK